MHSVWESCECVVHNFLTHWIRETSSLYYFFLCNSSYSCQPIASDAEKKFHDTARILNHMNQPISSCRTYYEELLQIAETTSRHGSPEGVQLSGICPEDQPHEMDRSAGGSSPLFDKSRSPTPMAIDEDPTIDTASSHSNSAFFTEFYPGASKTFGSGPTFMDNFNKDQFSKERQVHSHYPFASKDEWHMGSFLLRSGLSMAALDQFFKLKLVGDCYFILKTMLIFSR